MARRAKAPKGPAWPAWFYGPDGDSVICNTPEEVPEGWGRKPGTVEPLMETQSTVVLDREALVAELKRREIAIKPAWGNAHMKRIIDGDISPAW